MARTGADSVGRYAAMAREPISRFYCTDLGSLTNRLGKSLEETSRFANIELLETSDPTAYFDVRDEAIASPLQCYLELRSGDKRDQETAQRIRRLILSNVTEKQAVP